MSAVSFAQSAQTDLFEAWLYIAEENLTAADRVLDAIEEDAKILATQPLMGRARPELVQGIRSWPTSTPYILFYVAQADGIVVSVVCCTMLGTCKEHYSDKLQAPTGTQRR